MASEWQTSFVAFHKMSLCAVITAVINYNKSLEKLQDFFFETKTKTFILSSRHLQTKTLVLRTTSLHDKTVFTTPNIQDQDHDMVYKTRPIYGLRPVLS